MRLIESIRLEVNSYQTDVQSFEPQSSQLVSVRLLWASTKVMQLESNDASYERSAAEWLGSVRNDSGWASARIIYERTRVNPSYSERRRTRRRASDVLCTNGIRVANRIKLTVSATTMWRNLLHTVVADSVSNSVWALFWFGLTC